MNQLLTKVGKGLRWLWRRTGLLILLALVLFLVQGEGPPPGALAPAIDRIIADVRFHFWRWETGAVWSKFSYGLVQPQRYMRNEDRVAFVRDYMDQIRQIQELRWQVEVVYADPEVEDADAATADLRAELARIQSRATDHQPVAEAIIEEQVGFVLAQEGLGLLGRPFPPVGVRFTPLPYMLIVSPRDRIVTIYSESLEYGLGVSQREGIESRVDEAYDVSSLVTRIGGLSAWPAMLLESSYLPWVQEVSAHEWTHHYLGFHPLGWGYDRRQETRTINETTASIVGQEVGRAVLARYYPDLLPPEEEEEPTPRPPEPVSPPVFDFRLEMHKTRVEVDRLLEAGLVEEAERYMEERRQFFWENGYRIRKLNQAYFAFHGSYADEPGAAGEDPIGPAVRQLRQQSPSLLAFLIRIDGITTLEELRAALAR